MEKINLTISAIEGAISQLISELNKDNSLLSSVMPTISLLEKGRKKLISTKNVIEGKEKEG